LAAAMGCLPENGVLTCDHLRRVKMVDGTGIIHDSNDEPDLLWPHVAAETAISG